MKRTSKCQFLFPNKSIINEEEMFFKTEQEKKAQNSKGEWRE